MPEAYTTPVRLRLEMGRYIAGEDYVRALNGQEVLRDEVDAALATCDVLMLPTLADPGAADWRATVRVGDGDEPVRNIMLRLTQLFNLTRHPAMTFPVGISSEGLAIGLAARGLVDRAPDRGREAVEFALRSCRGENPESL